MHMKPADSRKDAAAPASSAVAEVSFTSACNGSEYADAERSLLGLPGVAPAHLDRTRGVAHVTYDRR
jgi:P-type Cu2+ transporter